MVGNRWRLPSHGLLIHAVTLFYLQLTRSSVSSVSYLVIQPGEKTASSSIFLKQKKYLTVEGQTMSINTVAVPLQGRAWANDSIGGLAAGQQDKHNTHIFIRQLHAGHMATC